MATLGTLTVDLVARTGSFVQGLDKGSRESEKFRRKVKKNLEDVGRQMKTLAVVGVAGLVGSFGAVVASSGRQEEAIKQLETRLKSTNQIAGLTSQELQNFASEMQKLTRFGDEAVIEMQSVLLTFTNIRGEIFQRTTPAILDLATAMNMDLQSATVQLGKALNDPVKNLSALSRAGIQFSEDQKAVIKTLVEQNKLADAQSIILAELERQFGGSAAAAADTFGGRLDQVKNAFGDLLENPAGLTANKKAFEDLRDILQDPETIRAAGELTSALINGFSGVIETVKNTIGFVQFLGEEVASIASGAASDDLVRLNEELVKMQMLLDSPSFSPNRVRFFGKGGVVEYWDDEELKAEMAKVREAIAQEQQRLENNFRYTSKPLPAPAAAAVNGGMPTMLPSPAVVEPAATGGDSSPSPARRGNPFDIDFLSEFNEPQEDFSFRESDFRAVEEDFEEHKNNMLDIERTSGEELRRLGNETFRGLSDAARVFAGEQSGIYRTLFAIEKGAAIARSIVAIQTAIAQASASLPFPANIGAMASVVAQTAGLVSTIQSTNIQGQAHDGMMSVPKTGSYILEQGERVMPAETTAKLDRTLEGMQGGAGGVRIINTVNPDDIVGEYLNSAAGERVIVNALKRNQRTVRQLAT